MSSHQQDKILEHPDHGDIPSTSIQETIITYDKPNTQSTEETSLILIENLTLQIEKIFIAIKDIHLKVDSLQEEKETPTGCGFSCSNNSLNM